MGNGRYRQSRLLGARRLRKGITMDWTLPGSSRPRTHSRIGTTTCVYLRSRGEAQIADTSLAVPSGYPKFEGLNMAPGMTFDPSTRPPPIAAQTSGSVRVPPLSPDKIVTYTQMFERAGAQNGLLSGMDK